MTTQETLKTAGDFERYTSGERLAHQLQRMLVRGRFRPMVLWLADGERIDVRRPTDVRVCSASGTIECSMGGDPRELLFEALLGIELRPSAPDDGRD